MDVILLKLIGTLKNGKCELFKATIYPNTVSKLVDRTESNEVIRL